MMLSDKKICIKSHYYIITFVEVVGPPGAKNKKNSITVLTIQCDYQALLHLHYISQLPNLTALGNYTQQ